MNIVVFGSNSKTFSSVISEIGHKYKIFGISRGSNSKNNSLLNKHLKLDLLNFEEEYLEATLTEFQPDCFISMVRYRNPQETKNNLEQSLETELKPLIIIRNWLSKNPPIKPISIILASSVAATQYRPELPIEYSVTKAATEKFLTSIDSQFPLSAKQMIWPNIINLSAYELLSHTKEHATNEFEIYKSKVTPYIGELTNERHISKVFETLIEAHKFGLRRQRITVDCGLSDFSMLSSLEIVE
jgi:hypothetical protein